MPFSGFNTCALVSPAISSNLLALNWSLCIGPSVLWERHTLFSPQRGYSGAGVFWIAPHLTSRTRTAGVTFHLLLATGKRSIPRRGGLPYAAPPPLIRRVMSQQKGCAHTRTHTHTQSNKTPTFYIHNRSKMESWVPDLLLSFKSAWWDSISERHATVSLLPNKTYSDNRVRDCVRWWNLWVMERRCVIADCPEQHPWRINFSALVFITYTVFKSCTRTMIEPNALFLSQSWLVL